MSARLALVVLVVLAALAGMVWMGRSPWSSPEVDYILAKVQRGDIESVVTATGTLAPLNTVVVGSELSGQIAALHADFNDTVTANQLIARLDPRTFSQRVEQARAAVAVAEAGIAQKAAELERAVAERHRSERAVARSRGLVAQSHVSSSELDMEETALAIARAQVAIAEAAIENAKAVHAQQLSALKVAELDLERTYIRSPVSGTVIKRNVEIGQTVAASLQAPELFQIAQDLRRMKVEANIDEMDIGRIAVGMECRFTVDAYPRRAFSGRVEQARKAPDVVFNVVTYKVIIAADNEDLALLPGMTANVAIVVGHLNGVLTVPNAALRFVPPEQSSPSSHAAPAAAASVDTVWRIRDGQFQPVSVQTGLSDGHSTEIVSGLEETDSVVLRAHRPEA